MLLVRQFIFSILIGCCVPQPTLSNLNLNDIWIDDFLVDDASGDPYATGWSSNIILEGQDNNNNPITYHGPFNDQYSTILYRHFNIETYSTISISFDYIWGCNPEPITNEYGYGDYFYVTLNGKQSQQWYYSPDDTTITHLYDSAITALCEVNGDGQHHSWSKHITFEAITAPNSQYLVEITSYLSNIFHDTQPWDEYGLISNIGIMIEPLCDFSPFQVDSSIIATYRESVGDEECRSALQNQIMEARYAIHIITEGIESISDDSYFGIDPLTPYDVADDITAEDRQVIADLLDNELADILEQDLDVLCPKLSNIYNNIAQLQRRLLMGTNPSIDADNAVFIERDNFCSFTDRISTDVDNDGVYEIHIQDTVITIPYDVINTGREEWRDNDMDSVDITVLCIDNVLLHECDIKDIEISNQFAVNIDISLDSTNSETPFTLTFPYSEENRDKVCGWVESKGQEWQYEGCTTSRSADSIICECNHQTVFSLVQDLRTNIESNTELNNAKALQITDVYIGFLVVYSILALIATYLVLTLYRIKDIKSLASIIVSVITAQIYSHVMQYAYLSFAELQSIPLGITYCVISLPLLCHFWVCSLLILHWMKIFECAKTFSASNKALDIAVIVMNIMISIIFVGLLIASMVVPQRILPSIVSASNGVLGFVGISICIAWFYFGYKTSSILMKSAERVKDTCSLALSEALTLRRRLLRLTFIIGLCFFTQSIVAILSSIQHLQLFGYNFVNFATIWAICDIIIFLTFILFYKTHVLRQKQIYMMDIKDRELEREARKNKRDKSYTNKHSTAIQQPEQSQQHSLFRRLGKLSMDFNLGLSLFDSKPRKSNTFTLPPPIDEQSELPKGSNLPVLRPTASSNIGSPTTFNHHPSVSTFEGQTSVIHRSSTFEVPTIENLPPVNGTRLSILSNSTISTVPTLKNNASYESNASDILSLKRGRTRSHDDSYLKKPHKNTEIWGLDNNDRTRSHSASRSKSSRAPSLRSNSSVDKVKKKEIKQKKSVSKQPSDDPIKNRKLKKNNRVQSDVLMKKKRENKKKGKNNRLQKVQHDKIRIHSDSLMKTKKKNKGKYTKSATSKSKETKGKRQKAIKQKAMKRSRSQTVGNRADIEKFRSKGKTNGKKSKLKNKTEKGTKGAIKPKKKKKKKEKTEKKEYDGNKMDDEIQKALHKVHEQTNSSSSIPSLHDLKGRILNASKSSTKLDGKRKGKTKLKKSRSQSVIDEKPKRKSKESRNKTEKVPKKSRKIKSKDSKKKKQKADK